MLYVSWASRARLAFIRALFEVNGWSGSGSGLERVPWGQSRLLLLPFSRVTRVKYKNKKEPGEVDPETYLGYARCRRPPNRESYSSTRSAEFRPCLLG